jgi:hypothetical protein
MSHSRPLFLAVLCAGLLSTGAWAQLKPPSAAPAPALKAAPAQPAVQAPAAPLPGEAEKEAAGKLAAAGWLTLLDRKDWGTAWESSAGMFRSTVPLATWMDAIPKARGPFGALVERTPAESQYRNVLEGRPPGDYVSVIFLTKFEQQEVEEIVTTTREADGKWRVTGYSTR